MTAATDHYKQGMALYGQGKNEEAVRAFEAALSERPEWSDCLQALGMTQMNLGRLDDALATLTRVTELAPEDPLAYTSLSMVWVRKENIEEAEKAQAKARMLSWKEELKRNPNAPPPSGGGPGVVQ